MSEPEQEDIFIDNLQPLARAASVEDFRQMLEKYGRQPVENSAGLTGRDFLEQALESEEDPVEAKEAKLDALTEYDFKRSKAAQSVRDDVSSLEKKVATLTAEFTRVADAYSGAAELILALNNEVKALREQNGTLRARVDKLQEPSL